MVDIERVRIEVADALPLTARWTLGDAELAFDFSRSRQALSTLRPSEINFELDAAWASLYLFGEMDFAGGGGSTILLAIHAEKLEILGLDVERPSSVLFFSSSARAFVRTFELFCGVVPAGTNLGMLQAQAKVIDPEGYGRSEWKLLVEHLIEGA